MPDYYVNRPSPGPRPIWVERYPPGAPAEVDVHRSASLADMLVGMNTLFRLLLDAPGFAEACRANARNLKVAVAGGRRNE